MILATAMTCMAINIYHEARGEDLSGQHAVAQVTWNRAKKDPKNVCNVVLAPYQFSWTTGLVVKKGRKAVLTKRGHPKNKSAWTLAQQIAKITIAGLVPDLVGGATFYHTIHVDPHWNKHADFRLVKTIGRHKFYRNT